MTLNKSLSIKQIIHNGVKGLTKTAGLFLFLLILISVANAQQIIHQKTATISLPVPQSQNHEEENFIKPARPSVANPAEIQKAEILQIEYGYDSNFRASDFKFRQSLPLNIRFAAHSRFLLEAEIETLQSERTEKGDDLKTGVGDTRLGFQALALIDSKKHPALAFAYMVKIPTSSESKMLGTGRFDHKLTVLLSKKIGENTDLDVNFAYLNVGREDSDRRADGGLAAISLSHEFENKFGFEAEVSGNSLDDIQPKGVYALGALTYKVNKRLRFDTGMRFGLSNEAPRIGFFAGFTVGVANLLKK